MSIAARTPNAGDEKTQRTTTVSHATAAIPAATEVLLNSDSGEPRDHFDDVTNPTSADASSLQHHHFIHGQCIQPIPRGW